MSFRACSILAIGLLTSGAGATLRAGDEPVPPPRTENFIPKGSSIIVPIGSTQRLQMKGKKPIQTVVNPKETVAVVQPVPDDPTTVLITGREAGTTRITLTANDRTEEVYEILVQFDVEYLRSLLARAVPTASLQLIPAASGVIIIAGTVAHAEDVDIIMRTAQSVVSNPDRIVNAMRVGGVQQVQLDVVVAFVSRSALREMSFDFLDVSRHVNFSSTVGGALQNPALGSALPSTPGLGLPVVNAVTGPHGEPANFFLGLFNNKNAFFGLLQALRHENLVKILAEPKLVTQSGRSATMLSGGQQAIPETAGLGSVSVRFEPFGTQLTFLPIVLGNGKIHLEVEPEVSDIDPTVGTTIAGTSVPGRSTQRVHTTVEMEDGQTLALGGLIQNRVVAGTIKVPILGDLPFLGAAFSSKTFTETEDELVVMVTPHLVDPQSCDQVVKVVPGQETRSPDDFELFLEGILEAPRGSREVFPGGDYLPAYKNGPSSEVYPCGATGCGGGSCRSSTSGGCTSSEAPLLPNGQSVMGSNEGVRSADGGMPAFGAKEGKPFELPAATGNTGGSR